MHRLNWGFDGQKLPLRMGRIGKRAVPLPPIGRIASAPGKNQHFTRIARTIKPVSMLQSQNEPNFTGGPRTQRAKCATSPRCPASGNKPKPGNPGVSGERYRGSCTNKPNLPPPEGQARLWLEPIAPNKANSAGRHTPLFYCSIIPPFRAKQTQFRAGPKEGQVPCG